MIKLEHFTMRCRFMGLKIPNVVDPKDDILFEVQDVEGLFGRPLIRIAAVRLAGKRLPDLELRSRDPIETFDEIKSYLASETFDEHARALRDEPTR